MCGIALIISGLRVNLTSLTSDYSSPSPEHEQHNLFCIGDLETVLRRRGPDSLGSKKLFLHSKASRSIEGHVISSFNEDEGVGGNESSRVEQSGDCLPKIAAELHFIGATLQLRGTKPTTQPLIDTEGNILIYNGEIFGGLHVDSNSNDGLALMQYLRECCSSNVGGNMTMCYGNGKVKDSVPDILSTIKGPWAMIYWENSSKTLWFGRDAFGRRSLLVHWPSADDTRLMLSSVSPPPYVDIKSVSEVENDIGKLKYWEELPCGIYSVSVGTAKLDGCLVGEVRKHEWTNSLLMNLIAWERTCIEPKPGSYDSIPSEFALPYAETVLASLREAVMRRTSLYTIFQVSSDNRQKELAPVAVLFSGGLDSMILAALLNECLNPIYEIDLLNVSFDGPLAPDRISGRAGVKELERIAPIRRWKLVEIDADLSKLEPETKHVMSLINPANTYMDLNIGIALWLAAGGDGWVYENGNDFDGNNQRVKYKSNARIVLVGSGADEQCAGYGRHRTKYRNGSWRGLYDEMKVDMQRIWKRNLGRDDRCIADTGKEARFPFLDEDVIRTLLDIPLWEVTDLNKPSGIGDKKILREVAQLLGLHGASGLPKRAIQFGSRIARESNRKNFGSNRAANQASAGSVVIHKP